MDNRISFKVEDFLRDDKFICYALNISSEACMQWESLLKEYSELIDYAEQAKAILRGEDMTYTLTLSESDALKKRIMDSTPDGRDALES